MKKLIKILHILTKYIDFHKIISDKYAGLERNKSFIVKDNKNYKIICDKCVDEKNKIKILDLINNINFGITKNFKIIKYKYLEQEEIKFKMVSSNDRYLIFIETQNISIIGYIEDLEQNYIFIGNDNGHALLTSKNIFYGNSDGSCPDFDIDKNIYEQLMQYTNSMLDNKYH